MRLGLAEREALSRITQRNLCSPFDGAVLTKLHRHKLIELTITGWRLTALGWSALLEGGVYAPRSSDSISDGAGDAWRSFTKAASALPSSS